MIRIEPPPTFLSDVTKFAVCFLYGVFHKFIHSLILQSTLANFGTCSYNLFINGKVHVICIGNSDSFRGKKSVLINCYYPSVVRLEFHHLLELITVRVSSVNFLQDFSLMQFDMVRIYFTCLLLQAKSYFQFNPISFGLRVLKTHSSDHSRMRMHMRFKY